MAHHPKIKDQLDNKKTNQNDKIEKIIIAIPLLLYALL